MAWLESHRREIEAGKLVVFLLDECHLLWGDVCGYVWGKTNERIEVPIVSDRQRRNRNRLCLSGSCWSAFLRSLPCCC